MPQTPTYFGPVHRSAAASADPVGSVQLEIDIVTCEYPPTVGGVADYTLKVATKLEQRGCTPTVWAPSGKGKSDALLNDRVIRSFTTFGLRDILLHDRLMGTPKDRCLLLQWEPVGFGLKSLNLFFCLWMVMRALRGTRLLVMFHETFLPFNKQSVKRYLAGTIQRLMASLLLNTADTVFVSNESGASALKRLCFRPEKVRHLPVFSNIESQEQNSEQAAAVRNEFVTADESLIGHFGRYMANTEPLVLPALKALLESNPKVKVLFIGECGAKYRSALLATNPHLDGRVFAPGIRTAEEISRLISACDLMFQPYPGGVTTKRSSTMAALAHGRCIVSNRGEETERLWSSCQGLQLIETSKSVRVVEELSRLSAARAELAQRGAAAFAYYQKHFSSAYTVEAILSSIGSFEAALVESFT